MAGNWSSVWKLLFVLPSYKLHKGKIAGSLPLLGALLFSHCGGSIKHNIKNAFIKHPNSELFHLHSCLMLPILLSCFRTKESGVYFKKNTMTGGNALLPGVKLCANQLL